MRYINRLFTYFLLTYCVCVHIAEFSMTLPNATSYRDIFNPQHISKVTMKSINDYLLSNDKTFDYKYRKLYEERYIRYVRVSSFDRLHYGLNE